MTLKKRGVLLKSDMDYSNSVAKERLIQMKEYEFLNCSQDQFYQMKKELQTVVSKYMTLTPEQYEIRLIMKQT